MARPPRITAAVQRLVERDTIYPPPVGRLTPAQVEALAAIAGNPSRVGASVSAARAIAALTQGAKPAAAIPVLARVLGSRTADVPARVAAANGLGLLGTPDAERALWRGVAADAPPRVVREALWALGTIGGPAALRRLGRVQVPDDAGTRRQLALARALIAHRHGFSTGVLPVLDAEPRRPEQIGDRVQPSLTLQTAAETRKDVQRLEGTTYGVEPGPRAASLSCGTNWVVFVNRAIEPATAAQRLGERPWVLGLMARRRSDLRALTVAQLLLTRPDGAVVRVDVVRPDGTRLYTGEAVVERGGVRITIGDVRRPGTAPAFLRLHVDKGGIAIDEAAVSGRRSGVRQSIGVPLSRASDKGV